MSSLLRAGAIPGAVLALALGLSACGSGTKTLDTSSGSAGTTADTSSDTAADSTDVNAAWLDDLNALVATGTTSADKAATVLGGDDLVPTFDQLVTALSGFSVTFEVKNPVVSGDSGTADILVLSNGQPFPQTYPAFFQKDGDAWRITRAGACSLISLSGVTCPE